MHKLGATLGGVTLASALLLAPVTALADQTANNDGSGNTINQSDRHITINRTTTTSNGSGNFCGNDLGQTLDASNFKVSARQSNDQDHNGQQHGGDASGGGGGNGGDGFGGDVSGSGNGGAGTGAEGGAGAEGQGGDASNIGDNNNDQSQTVTQTNNVYQALTITCGPDGPVVVQSSNVKAGEVGLPKTGTEISSDLVSSNVPSLLGLFAILVSLGLGRVAWLSRAGRRF